MRRHPRRATSSSPSIRTRTSAGSATRRCRSSTIAIQRLRRRLYDGPESVVARWLGPHGLDGWRIDVANMTARLGATDLNHMVATTIRATMAAANPEALLLAEHSHDASARPSR